MSWSVRTRTSRTRSSKMRTMYPRGLRPRVYLCGDRVGPHILFLFDSTCILKPPAEILRVLMYNHFWDINLDLIYSQLCVSFIDCHFAVFHWIWQSFDSDRSHLAFIDALDGFQWFVFGHVCWRITGEWGIPFSHLLLAICIIQFSQSAFFPL